MTDLLTRLQNWYKINCDGDWEHSYGMSLTTLDNPGWHLIMNLSDTALENLQYIKEYQNKDVENDWFQLNVKNKKLEAYCGPSNLSQILNIFFDDIISNYSDNNFLYEVYLPMTGHEPIVWIPAQGKMLSENTLELIEVPPVKYSEIKLRNLDDIDFTENDMHIFTHAFKVGDSVSIDLEDMFDGVKLVAKTKK